jgi:hypothetical protein
MQPSLTESPINYSRSTFIFFSMTHNVIVFYQSSPNGNFKDNELDLEQNRIYKEICSEGDD